MRGVLRIAGMLALFGIDWLIEIAARIYVYVMVLMLFLALFIIKDSI